MKRALVLAGGGARGAYHVGMLEELVANQGLDFQVLRGVSVGALNASVLAQAPLKGGAQALRKKVLSLGRLWAEIRGNGDIYRERGGFPVVFAGADSLFSLEPLRKLIEKNISHAALKRSGRDFSVGTVSLVSGEYREWRPREKDFLEILIASASIPVAFPYKDLKPRKDVLVDGGARNIAPLSSAFSAGPDEIYVLLTSRLLRHGSEFPASGVQVQAYRQWDDSWLGTKVNGLDVLARTVDILTDEIYLDDIRGALHWNEVAGAVDALKTELIRKALPRRTRAGITNLLDTMNAVRKRNVKICVIAPREWYGPENRSTEFSPELITRAIEHGKEVAADPSLWLWPPA